MDNSSKTADHQKQHTTDDGCVPANTEFGTELTGTQSNVVDREDVVPDGGYGWVCVICFLLINAHTWGVNSVRTIRDSLVSIQANVSLGLGCLPRALSTGLLLPGRFAVHLRTHRWAFYLAKSCCLATRRNLEPEAWNEDFTAYWHWSRVVVIPGFVLRHGNLATLLVAGLLLWIWPRISVSHSSHDPSTMVPEAKKSGHGHLIFRSRHWRHHLQPRCRSWHTFAGSSLDLQVAWSADSDR